MKRFFTRENLKQFTVMTFATALVALGIYFFRFPNHFSIGGVSGGTGSRSASGPAGFFCTCFSTYSR